MYKSTKRSVMKHNGTIEHVIYIPHMAIIPQEGSESFKGNLQKFRSSWWFVKYTNQVLCIKEIIFQIKLISYLLLYDS